MKNKYAGVAIFLGSMLLFGIQPMLGRTLLPSFGGTAAVWTVCLATYQTLLLAGYFYAHWMSRKKLATQQRIHTLLLIVAVLWSVGFALVREPLKFMIGNSPIPALEVLFCVMLFVGLPYTLLAAGSTLVQSWLATQAQHDNRGIYRLYALSNLGSFTGLFIYPLLLEPYTTLSSQWWGFAGLLTGYAVLLSFIGRTAGGKYSVFSIQCSDTRNSRTPSNHQAPTRAAELPWLVLPALSVFTLNAITAHLTLDVMPLPLLWAVLLGLFLLSYVVGFSGKAERLLKPLLFLTLLSGLAVAGLYQRTGASTNHGFIYNLLSCLFFCFFGASFIHAWLYSLRPAVTHLTRFYLYNAAGGAFGGITASLIAPVLFNQITEFPIALVLVVGASVLYLFTHKTTKRLRWRGVIIAVGVVSIFIHSQLPESNISPQIMGKRDFYGILRIYENKAKTTQNKGVIREYVHGSTVHGIQVLIPGKERMTTTYYTPQSGGYAIQAHPKYRKGEPMRVNLMGLGIGVMLGYARTNDFYRCYEISPATLSVATNSKFFTFVSGCPSTVELVKGDARKGLEAELAAGVEPYDVIQIDAFTGDNIPYHLSTKEAFELYFKMLKPDGILTVNISNWHLDLAPFIKAIGEEFKCPVLCFTTPSNLAELVFPSKTAIFCRHPQNLAQPPRGVNLVNLQQVRNITLPTDEKGSFVRLITW